MTLANPTIISTVPVAFGNRPVGDVVTQRAVSIKNATKFNSSSATFSLASHNADLSDVSLTTGPVRLTAQINNYAVSAFTKQPAAARLAAAVRTTRWTWAS